MDKKVVGKEVLSDTIFEMIRNVGAKGIGEIIKEAGLSSGKELAAELALETAPELVPIIGNAVRSYRMNHRFSRIDPKLKKYDRGKVKIETDDKYVISKFGRDFFRYFIRENRV